MSDAKKVEKADAPADGAKKKKSGGQANQKKGKDLGTAINTTYKNKVRALVRHLKAFPGDVKAEQALAALKKAGTIVHPRKAPKRPEWTPGKIFMAQMAAKVGYNGNVAANGWGNQNTSVFAGFKERYQSAGLGLDMSPAAKARRAAAAALAEELAEREKAERQARAQAKQQDEGENQGRHKKGGKPSGKPAGKTGGKPGFNNTRPGGKPGGKPTSERSGKPGHKAT